MSKPLELLATAAVSLGIGVLIGARLFGDISETLAASPSLGPEREAPVGAQAAPAARPLASPLLAATPAKSRARAAVKADERPPPPAASPVASETGTSSIEGSIVTLSGAPLAGAELELEPPLDSPRYRARSTTSDADGHFVFTGLPQGAWDISGRHPEYVLQRKTSYPVRIPTGATVELLACPGVSVEVRVVGVDAERARVAYRRDADGRDQPRWSSWSPASPRITLGPGAWKVCALVDPLEDWPSDRGWKLAPLASLEHTVQVGTERPQIVTLTVEPISCLYGTVKLPGGHQGSSRPRLSLIEPEDGTRADFDSPGDRTLRGVRVDEQGRFGLFRLPYERWTAGVALSWGTPSSVEVVEVHGLTRIDFDRFEIEIENSVVVDAFTPAGHRITEGLSLSLIHRDADSDPDDELRQSTRTVLEEGGSLRVIALPMEPEQAKEAAGKQELVLRASMAGFATIDQPLSGLHGERFRLSFAPSAELAVELVGEGGLRAMRKAYARLEGARVDLGARFDEAEGAFTFKGLHPGSYMLSLRSWTRSGDSYRNDRLFHDEVDVSTGSQRFEIPMPARANLVVRCPGVKKDVSAVLRAVIEDRTEDDDDEWGSTYAQADVDELGQVHFENILTGTYRLTIGSRIQEVRVPSPVIDFEGILPDRFMFRLEKDDSPLRRAGVRSGDVPVAVDGEELRKEAMEARLEVLSSQSEGSLRLTVERAGRRVDLTLDANDLGEDESFSASLEPDLGGA